MRLSTLNLANTCGSRADSRQSRFRPILVGGFQTKDVHNSRQCQFSWLRCSGRSLEISASIVWVGEWEVPAGTPGVPCSQQTMQVEFLELDQHLTCVAIFASCFSPYRGREPFTAETPKKWGKLTKFPLPRSDLRIFRGFPPWRLPGPSKGKKQLTRLIRRPKKASRERDNQADILRLHLIIPELGDFGPYHETVSNSQLVWAKNDSRTTVSYSVRMVRPLLSGFLGISRLVLARGFGVFVFFVPVVTLEGGSCSEGHPVMPRCHGPFEGAPREIRAAHGPRHPV